MAEMPAQEPHQLAANLQGRHVAVQQQPVNTLNLERHMTLEHVIDVRHARHPRMVTRRAGFAGPDSRPATGEAGRGARPPPAK